MDRIIHVDEDTMYIIRLDADTDCLWELDLIKVYQAYMELEDFDTVSFKPYVPRRHSPARGLLLHLGLLK